MTWLRQIDAFLRSELAFHFWQEFYLVLSVLGIPVIIFLVWLLFRVGRQYELKRKRLKEVMNSPDMKDVRYLFKPWLKEHGIHTQDESKLDEDKS